MAGQGGNAPDARAARRASASLRAADPPASAAPHVAASLSAMVLERLEADINNVVIRYVDTSHGPCTYSITLAIQSISMRPGENRPDHAVTSEGGRASSHPRRNSSTEDGPAPPHKVRGPPAWRCSTLSLSLSLISRLNWRYLPHACHLGPCDCRLLLLSQVVHVVGLTLTCGRSHPATPPPEWQHAGTGGAARGEVSRVRSPRPPVSPDRQLLPDRQPPRCQVPARRAPQQHTPRTHGHASWGSRMNARHTPIGSGHCGEALAPSPGRIRRERPQQYRLQ